MRIIYLHQYFTTPEHAGGVRSYQFARRLVERGVAVDMVTSSAFMPIEKANGERFVSHRQIDGIDVHVIHTSYDNEMPFLRRIFAFLAFTMIASVYILKLKKRDLVFATSTPLTIGIPGLIAKYYHRIPMVFEVRDLWPDVPIAMGIIRNSLLIKLLKWFEAKLYRASSKVVALSEGMIEELRNKQVPDEKLVLVPNASDIIEFEGIVSECEADPIAALRTGPDTKICLYAGTLGIVNNIDYLVALAREFRTQKLDLHIIIIGAGSQKQRISEVIDGEQLYEFITLLEPVSKTKLVPYLHASDACISTVQDIPALFNNSANKFFDALAVGRPIVINHSGWQAEVIKRHNLGIVLGQDPQIAATELDRYLRTNIKKSLEQSIKAFASENYSREILFDRFLSQAIHSGLRNDSL